MTIIGIQARMNSRRLPNKAIMKLDGRTIIEWIIIRLLKEFNSSDLFLLTSRNSTNNELKSIASEYKIQSISTSNEDDVLSRFIELIEKTNTKNGVIRICADNPLVSGQRVKKLITFAEKAKVDYAWNHTSLPSLAESSFYDGFGAEYYSLGLLREMDKTATLIQREHLTNFVLDNSCKIKYSAYEPNDGMESFMYRFDVDTKRDLFFMKELIKRSYLRKPD